MGSNKSTIYSSTDVVELLFHADSLSVKKTSAISRKVSAATLPFFDVLLRKCDYFCQNVFSSYDKKHCIFKKNLKLLFFFFFLKRRLLEHTQMWGNIWCYKCLLHSVILWHGVFHVYKIANYAILFKNPLHKNEAVPKLAIWYRTI